MIKAVGVSGPSGSGKDYLINKAASNLGLNSIQMVTTRPSRSKGEFKQCVSNQEYLDLLDSGLLITDHIYMGYRYAFKIDDFKTTKPIILELDPLYIGNYHVDLSQCGVTLISWIGITAEVNYLEEIIRRRDQLSDQEMRNRLVAISKISYGIKKLYQRGVISSILEINYKNKEEIEQEFIRLVSQELVN